MILYLTSKRWYFGRRNFGKQVNTLLICIALLIRYCMILKVYAFIVSFFLLNSYFCCFSWLTNKSLVVKCVHLRQNAFHYIVTRHLSSVRSRNCLFLLSLPFDHFFQLLVLINRLFHVSIGQHQELNACIMSDEYVSIFPSLHGLLSRVQSALMYVPFTITRKKWSKCSQMANAYM